MACTLALAGLILVLIQSFACVRRQRAIPLNACTGLFVAADEVRGCDGGRSSPVVEGPAALIAASCLGSDYRSGVHAALLDYVEDVVGVLQQQAGDVGDGAEVARLAVVHGATGQ